MRQVKRWRYYCDHCKKAGGSKFHMEKHEKGCTANPGRVCGMCEVATGGHGLSVKDLISLIGDGGQEALDRLREATDGCPACMLAAIRQSGVNEFEEGHNTASKYIDFDFKKERDQFWSERSTHTSDPDYY